MYEKTVSCLKDNTELAVAIGILLADCNILYDNTDIAVYEMKLT